MKPETQGNESEGDAKFMPLGGRWIRPIRADRSNPVKLFAMMKVATSYTPWSSFASQLVQLIVVHSHARQLPRAFAS